MQAVDLDSCDQPRVICDPMNPAVRNASSLRQLLAHPARWLLHQEREGALCIGSPGLGKRHVAKALAHLAVQRGYKAF
jgi:DNA replication protein DnaC